MFGFNFVPDGGSQADGSTLPVSGNASLFTQIGTTFGGNGTTTFSLPNVNGRVPVGTGQGPGLTNRNLGAKAGVDFNTLAVANLPPSVGGQAVPLNNLQPSLSLNYLIAVNGVFPPSGGTGTAGGRVALHRPGRRGRQQFPARPGEHVPAGRRPAALDRTEPGPVRGARHHIRRGRHDHLRPSRPARPGGGRVRRRRRAHPRIPGTVPGTETTTITSANLPPPTASRSLTPTSSRRWR